jgi:hypothetical protein
LNAATLLAMALTVACAIWKLRQNLRSGLCLIFGLLVFLPDTMRIELPGALPQITIHRILIVLAFCFLISGRDAHRKKLPVPNLTLVLIFGAEQLLSAAIGDHFVTGIKGCINYGVETILFYVLISEYVQGEDDLVPLLRGICYGLAAVAVVASFEKYGHFNPLERLGLPAAAFLEDGGDITATYPHRILLGYAMVMGVPLALALSTQVENAKSKRNLYGITLLLIAAAYFSTSRGPWLGLAIGMVGIAVLGGPILRRKLIYIGLLTGAIAILRPGVWETIDGLWQQTFSDSEKGSTYQYRWQLWAIAVKEIEKSPSKFLFGCGPLSTEFMDLSDNWAGEEGSQASIVQIGHTSWDNNYACDLIELGLVGFGLELLLFATIAACLIRNWSKCEGESRILLGGVTVSCVVFMYSMTNVYIFAPQLKYLFWSLVAVGSNWPQVVANRNGRLAMEKEPGEMDLVAEVEV